VVDYRDERQALRERVNELERSLADATKRADRAEQDLALARVALNEREAELRRLRNGGANAPPPRSKSIAPYLVLAAVPMAIVGYLMLGTQRPSPPPPPPEPVAPATVVAAPPPPKPTEPNIGDGPGSGGVVPENERLQWGIGGGPSVFPAHIDDDGVEDFVGLYRVFDGGHTLYVGGFDGATLKRKWASAPLGTLSEGVTSTHAALVGSRVLVTDFRSRGHVIDISTGREVATITLTDRARRLCPIPGTGQVWVEVADDKHVAVDLAAARMTPSSAPPPTCVADFARPICGFAHAPCAASTADAPGTRGIWTLGPDGAAVTVGVKTPGTPTAVAFAAGGKGWLTTIAADPAIELANPFDTLGADLAGGLFVSAHALVEKGARLVALDARTGERRWDVAIPRSASGSPPHGLTATEARIYVPHWTWLDIFELKSGRVIGTVGMW
jgi:outer membrane protein assembly factor BamB